MIHQVRDLPEGGQLKEGDHIVTFVGYDKQGSAHPDDWIMLFDYVCPSEEGKTR